MNKKKIAELLKKTPLKDLLGRADLIREKYAGKAVHIRGIIEFSNYCVNSCLYCGLREENKKISRYRMPPEAVVSLALEISRLGVKTIVLQSGEDPGYRAKDIANIITQIKEHAEVAITLSVGQRDFSDYELWRKAGADRYLMKHETLNPLLYQRLHPGQSLEERLKHIFFLKEIGFEIGVGNIIGLPGQTLEDLAEDVLFMGEIKADMAGIGPFVPQADTPLANHPPGDVELSLRTLAVTRLVCKWIHLPATTALATLGGDKAQKMALRAGANVLMPNFTPEDLRQNYQIYDQKVCLTLKKAQKLIRACGLSISTDKGGTLQCRIPPRA
ncbi:[FeFe] hydrogenase H-cluster radical SAM maturase HydE [Thermodesulfatator atlanticus]|uniref:[FeFe] hydrogenase H-cluster radical SAM maturase HydE n=1 Tax=Thermodesulfatator atlanticus TaxID=501497 RepID=UPI0003B44838|nr:[FeFe] hydrogenase H-cluster radical SAM maturase HydE [Thermodesulfatator atlanticus]